jgi:thiol-disulfide isomerase/thioredoxin
MDKMIVQSPDSVIKEIDMLVSKAGDADDMYKYLVITLTSKYEKSKIMCMDKVAYHMFKNYYQKDPRTDWIDSTTKEKIDDFVLKNHYSQCGDVGQNLMMKDTTGKIRTLYDIDKEHTVVVFWSATCGHCKKTMPKLSDYYKETKDQYDYEIYAVDIDYKESDLKKFREFSKKHGFEWINVYDPEDANRFRHKYNVYSTPTFYLLDADKKIIAKRFDIETLKRILENSAK